jgi:hypothetical protein
MTYTPPIDPDPREEKLPRWARDLLDNMRRRVERAETTAEATRLATKPDETDTVINRYGDEPVGLPPGCSVEFRLGPPPEGRTYSRNYVHCRVEATKHGTWLDLSGGDSISVEH